MTIHGCCFLSHIFPTIRSNIASSWSTDTKVSAINWGFYYCYFCLSCRILPDPYVVDFLHILNIFFVPTTKTYTVPLYPHIVYCLNNHNTFVVLTTDKPQQFTVVVFFLSHIFPTIRVNVAYSLSTNKEVSAIHWGFYYCCFLSCRLPPVPHVVDCLHILRTFCVATIKTYTVPLDPHILYCLNNHNTFVYLTTNTPRLFTALVFFYHIFSQKYGQTLNLHHQLTQR